MDIAQFFDIFLHLDKHLADVVSGYGAWVYVILFTIIFVETGLVVMPFLPGDSLLFVAGAIAAVGGMNFTLVIGLLIAAAILGDSVNFSVGRAAGAKVFGWQQSRFFNRAAFDRAHAFYRNHGAITIIVARFLPFVRTFVPFVAGVTDMHRFTFSVYNIIGAILWVSSLTTLGYFIGNLPWVAAHFSWVALGMIIIPSLPAVFELARHTVFARKNPVPVPVPVPVPQAAAGHLN